MITQTTDCYWNKGGGKPSTQVFVAGLHQQKSHFFCPTGAASIGSRHYGLSVHTGFQLLYVSAGSRASDRRRTLADLGSKDTLDPFLMHPPLPLTQVPSHPHKALSKSNMTSRLTMPEERLNSSAVVPCMKSFCGQY